MKSFIKNLLILFSSLVLTITSFKALALSCSDFDNLAWNPLDPNNYYCQPYAGIDAQWRVTEPMNGFGNNLFKRHYIQGNVYLGFKLCDYLGIELGYEMTPTRTKTSTVGAGELSLGVPVINPPELHLSKSRVQGWHTGIMGYYPVCNFLGNTLFRNPVELLAYVGQVRLHCYYQDALVKNSTGPIDVATSTRTYDSTRSLLRLGLGAQYTYCTSGVRFMVGYESTNQFRNVTSQEIPSSQKRLKLQDSMFVSFGIFVTIP